MQSKTCSWFAAMAALVVSGCGEAEQQADPPAAPYTITAWDDARITADPMADNYRRIQATIELIDGPFEQVTLVLDLGTTCFPFEGWADDPAPPGELWPPKCDAFDRNFEVSLLPAAGSTTPEIELMHGITPFGGPLHVEVDITDIANGLPGTRTIEAFISTSRDAAGRVSGSDGGWNLSGRIEVVPGVPEYDVISVQPLIKHRHNQGDDESITMASFTVPEGTINSRIEYRASGHGGGDVENGCIGPADEFCPRTHSVAIDGVDKTSTLMWRTDCETLCTRATDAGRTYCMENPTGSIASVEASRANWCPGDVTPPLLWDFSEIAPGEHVFDYDIDRIGNGGNWRVSAVYIAYGPHNSTMQP